MKVEQTPVETIGKYRVLGTLGKGGMGIVYKGLDPDIEREVAIKTVRFDTYVDGPAKEDLLQRVMREAKAAGRLTHPNIITIYDVIRENDLTFIVMQYVDGQSLQALIETGRAFSPRQVVDLVKPVAEALDYAHENGIVHRDVKPANILVDRSERPFLADFGVARLETSTMTGPGTAIGTLSYMSPEQVMGKPADGRADLFALGVILYELLAGRKPFAGDNLSTIVYKIVHDEPPSLLEANKDLPGGYEKVIRRALAKNPEDRYQTGRELVHDLEDPENLELATRDFEQRRDGSAPSSRARRRIPVPALGALAFAVVAGGLVLLRPWASGGPSGAVPPAPAAEASLSPAAGLDEIRASVERRDYEGAVRLAEAVLREDPGQVEARELRDKARTELDLARAGPRLEEGIASFEAGDYAAAVLAMEDVLKLDRDNGRAADYLFKADTALSRRAIRALIEARRRAEESEDLAAVLRPLAPGSSAGDERAYYMAIFTIYDGIESRITESSISIAFSDRTRATASFQHAIRGVSGADGKPKVVLLSQERWFLEKRSGAWNIVRTERS